MSEIERFQKLVALANEWLSKCDGGPNTRYFMPDEEGNRIAVQRTEACARELLDVLAGEKP